MHVYAVCMKPTPGGWYSRGRDSPSRYPTGGRGRAGPTSQMGLRHHVTLPNGTRSALKALMLRAGLTLPKPKAGGLDVKSGRAKHDACGLDYDMTRGAEPKAHTTHVTQAKGREVEHVKMSAVKKIAEGRENQSKRCPDSISE